MRTLQQPIEVQRVWGRYGIKWSASYSLNEQVVFTREHEPSEAIEIPDDAELWLVTTVPSGRELMRLMGV